MAQTNAYIIFRQLYPDCTHSDFFLKLARELFKTYANRNHRPGRPTRSHASSNETSSNSMAMKPAENLQGKFEAAATKPTQGKFEAAATKPTQDCVSGRFAGSYKRECWACYREGKYVVKPSNKREGEATRRQYPRSHYGCKTCDVALCRKGECWNLYHSKYGSEKDQSVKGKWEKSPAKATK
jgi:hypothetical protein